MILKGKTRQGKNKIKEAGTNSFVVIPEENRCLVPANESARKIWNDSLLIEPAPLGSNSSKWRWILKKNDPDFEIIKGE